MMRPVITFVFHGFLCHLLLVGCSNIDDRIANGDDPLAALQARTVTTRYTSEFWKRVRQKDRLLFEKAALLCEHNIEKYPNCSFVAPALIIDNHEKHQNQKKEDQGFTVDELVPGH